MEISHPVLYSQRKYLPRNKSEGEHKFCTSATLQSCQKACARTNGVGSHTQSSIISSNGVSEIKKFALNLVLVISGHNTRLRKNHQCLRGRTPCLHSNINEFLSEPSAIIRDTHTAEAFSERERRGAVRTFAQGNTTVLPAGIKSHFW